MQLSKLTMALALAPLTASLVIAGGTIPFLQPVAGGIGVMVLVAISAYVAMNYRDWAESLSDLAPLGVLLICGCFVGAAVLL